MLNGWKTYLAAAGLFGLAVYQLSMADYNAAWTSLMAALATFGVRNAMARAGM
jgi:high-affinity Fe2+/Pb2+ permease